MRMFVCAWLPFQSFNQRCSSSYLHALLYPQAEAAIAQRRAKGVMTQYFFPSDTSLPYAFGNIWVLTP